MQTGKSSNETNFTNRTRFTQSLPSHFFKTESALPQKEARAPTSGYKPLKKYGRSHADRVTVALLRQEMQKRSAQEALEEMLEEEMDEAYSIAHFHSLGNGAALTRVKRYD